VPIAKKTRTVKLSLCENSANAQVERRLFDWTFALHLERIGDRIQHFLRGIDRPPSTMYCDAVDLRSAPYYNFVRCVRVSARKRCVGSSWLLFFLRYNPVRSTVSKPRFLASLATPSGMVHQNSWPRLATSLTSIREGLIAGCERSGFAFNSSPHTV
jgi:hypothetical protein